MMTTTFATIQFIDSHSSSIPHKNLIVLDAMPLWMYNAVAARGVKRALDDEKDAEMRIVGNYICTDYGDDIIPDTEFGKKIPRYAIDVGKCKLATRVVYAVSHLKAIPETKYVDAFVLLLGNVRAFDAQSMIRDAMKRWCQLKSLGMNQTGLLTVSNYEMYGPGRALSIDGFHSAKRVFCIDNEVTEEKEQEKGISWFFDGGVMIMDAENFIPGFKGADGEYEWLRYGEVDSHKFATQFPYLGDSVYAMCNQHRCIELDAAWQLPLMSKSSLIDAETALKQHMERQEFFKSCKYMT